MQYQKHRTTQKLDMQFETCNADLVGDYLLSSDQLNMKTSVSMQMVHIQPKLVEEECY